MTPAWLALAACSGNEATDTSGAMTTTTTMTTGADSTDSTAAPPTSTSDTPTTTGATGAMSTSTADDTDTTNTTDTTDTTDTTGAVDPSTGSSTGDPPEQDPRLEALVRYAPRVWMHPDEEYFPSSVEFAFPHMTRFADGEGNHWVRSTQALASASDTLPFFAGDLGGAPVYAYYADKGGGIVDLVYFFYYPYNRGKSVVNTIWGNHVGDWEHITVRLTRLADDTLTPVQAYLSAHSFGGVYEWEELERHDTTHPVVYSAWGSHGVWREPGAHTYMTIGKEVFGVCVTLVCTDLTDHAAPGIAWDTWENVAGFDYVAKEGLGDTTWPAWMSEDFKDPGAAPATTPGGGPIYRWGNTEDCSTLGVDISDLIGVCRLENGPTGPVSKNVWGPELQ